MNKWDGSGAASALRISFAPAQSPCGPFTRSALRSAVLGATAAAASTQPPEDAVRAQHMGVAGEATAPRPGRLPREGPAGRQRGHRHPLHVLLSLSRRPEPRSTAPQGPVRDQALLHMSPRPGDSECPATAPPGPAAAALSQPPSQPPT